MPKITTSETAEERKRRADRERIAAKRAAMDPQERAARRREHDAIYRARHRGKNQEGKTDDERFGS